LYGFNGGAAGTDGGREVRCWVFGGAMTGNEIFIVTSACIFGSLIAIQPAWFVRLMNRLNRRERTEEELLALRKRAWAPFLFAAIFASIRPLVFYLNGLFENFMTKP
jgi:hypothetical protein